MVVAALKAELVAQGLPIVSVRCHYPQASTVLQSQHKQHHYWVPLQVQSPNRAAPQSLPHLTFTMFFLLMMRHTWPDLCKAAAGKQALLSKVVHLFLQITPAII